MVVPVIISEFYTDMVVLVLRLSHHSRPRSTFTYYTSFPEKMSRGLTHTSWIQNALILSENERLSLCAYAEPLHSPTFGLISNHIGYKMARFRSTYHAVHQKRCVEDRQLVIRTTDLVNEDISLPAYLH